MDAIINAMQTWHITANKYGDESPEALTMLAIVKDEIMSLASEWANDAVRDHEERQ